jgi:chromosome segregation ATPase
MDRNIESERARLEEIGMEINRHTKEANEAKIELSDLNDTKNLKLKKWKELQMNCKSKMDKHSLLLKECDHLRKANKREEHNRNLLKNNINDYQMQKDKIERDKADLETDQERKEN